MTTTEQRELMLKDLATILEWQRTHEQISKERSDNNEIDHNEIKSLLLAQNGRVRENDSKISKNSVKISYIIGVGTAVGFLLSLGVFFL